MVFFEMKGSMFPPYAGQVDLIFVLDSSGSVSSYEWEYLQQFTSNVIGQFTLGPRDTQVGVVNYGSRAEILVELGTPTKENYFDADWFHTKRFGGYSNTSGTYASYQWRY